MRRLSIIAALGAAGFAQAGEPKAALQLNSGLRPLGLPLEAGLGGALRAGLVAGPVMPFLGAGAAFGQSQERDVDNPSHGLASQFTAQVGARFRVVRLEAAETYLIGGAMLSNQGGKTVWDPDQDNYDSLRFSAGPGGFGGGGADAFVSEQLSVAVEGGVAYASGGFKTASSFRNRSQNGQYDGASLLFTYASVGLTVWLGGAE